MTHLKQPINIHCLALNYPGVGQDKQEPLYFVKSASSFNPNPDKIDLPKSCPRFWTEVELGIVVARDCASITEDEAEGFISGYVICADLTVGNMYGRDHHLAYSKSRAGFCPCSTEIVSISKDDLDALSLGTKINGEETQRDKIGSMHFNPYRTLSYLSQLTTLQKDDLILTGTPSGVENNLLKSGDHVEHYIDGIGTLEFSIV